MFSRLFLNLFQISDCLFWFELTLHFALYLDLVVTLLSLIITKFSLYLDILWLHVLYLDAVLQAVKLPASIADLNAGLADVDGEAFSLIVID